MAGVNFQRVREAIPIMRVLGLVAFKRMKQHGAEARGVCPLCKREGRRERAFAVDLGRDKWWCHRCHRGGDVIDLWAAFTGMGAYEAAIDLCNVLNIPVPYVAGPWKQREGTEKRNGTGSPLARPLDLL